MIPMVSMILKWEKELEDPNRHLRQAEVYGRLLRSKNTDTPKPKREKQAKAKKEYGHVQSQPCCEIA